jgi:hypothetical protein
MLGMANPKLYAIASSYRVSADHGAREVVMSMALRDLKLPNTRENIDGLFAAFMRLNPPHRRRTFGLSL